MYDKIVIGTFFDAALPHAESRRADVTVAHELVPRDRPNVEAGDLEAKGGEEEHGDDALHGLDQVRVAVLGHEPLTKFEEGRDGRARDQ